MQLYARDLLSDAVVTVEADARLIDVASSIGKSRATHVAVFDEGKFVSLVRLQDILLSSPHRIFADLTPIDPTPCIDEAMPADQVAEVMSQSGIDAVPVLGPDNAFGGAVTNTSLLQAKLDHAEDWRSQSERLVRSLEKDRTHLHAILATAVDGIIAIDERGIVQSFSRSAEEMFGYEAAEIIDQSILELVPPLDQERYEKHIDQYLRTGEPRINGTEREVLGRRKDGSVFPVEIAVSLAQLDGRRLITGIIRDVTERQRAHEELRSAKEVADTANQAKSEFLANMSHEIRAPMTAVLGYTDILMERDTTDSERLNSVLTIRRNGEHLLKVINDILDLSKLEAKKLNVESIACEPAQILQEVRDLLPLRAAEEQVDLTVEAVGAIPKIIQTDPMRLRQMLVNLVGNAIKFGRQEPVRVTVECDAKKEALTFQVIDQGIGMTGGQIQRLFNPFEQAEKSTVRRFGGSGLGLSITQHLARLLGGDVTVESKLNEGSTFSLTIATGPLKGVEMVRKVEIKSPSAKSSQQSKPAPKLSGRVLLVEDGVDNQRLISWILTRAGADVTLARDGQEGLDLVLGADRGRRKKDPPKPFDIVIMDMQMPVMDGYEATKILRSSGFEGQIVALTADAMKEEVERCLEVGCDLHLSKPIQRDLLLEEMAARMGERSTRS